MNIVNNLFLLNYSELLKNIMVSRIIRFSSIIRNNHLPNCDDFVERNFISQFNLCNSKSFPCIMMTNDKLLNIIFYLKCYRMDRLST